VGTTTSTGNVNLVRSLGADEVIDYKMQDFQDVLRDYDAVLGTVRGDALEKALRILKPQSAVVSLGGPPETEADWRRVADTLRRLHRLTQGWPQGQGWRSSTDLLRRDRDEDRSRRDAA
jgi:NADPH:quinone reductase-like Zn-dependent oxidoreductase